MSFRGRFGKSLKDDSKPESIGDLGLYNYPLFSKLFGDPTVIQGEIKTEKGEFFLNVTAIKVGGLRSLRYID